MALLDRNNTEFSVSVTRDWSPHIKSTALKDAVAALVKFQNEPTPGNLSALFQRLYGWMRDNPKEYAKRGGRVGDLRGEILKKATDIGANVGDIDRELRGLPNAPGTWKRELLLDVQTRAGAHAAVWQKIEITDQPTERAGVYDFTPENHYAEEDRKQATLDAEFAGIGKNKELAPIYWLLLGRRVVTPQVDGKCYGRCFSCAAAVIYELIMDPLCDEYLIEHVGAADFDHHLVLVDRSNANGTSAEGLERRREWRGDTAVIDVWQGNLGDRYVSPADVNRYTDGNVKWFCAFPPSRRTQDRVFAGKLQAPERQALKLDIIDQVKRTGQGTGPETEFVRGPGGKGWVPKPT